MSAPSPRPYGPILIVCLGALSVLRAVFASVVELSPDEAYYWTWAQNLDLGYFDHPPLIAWVIRLTTWIVGDGELGVRMGAIVFGALTPWLVYKITCMIIERRDWAFWVALLVALCPLLSVGSVIHTPDAALSFFWALACWAALAAFHSDRLIFWVVLGLSCGLAGLSKTTGLLLIPAVGLYALACKAGRARLVGYGPLCGLVLALLLLLPNMIWNANHQGGSTLFQLQHALANLHFRPLGLLEFAGGQLGVISPLLWLGLVGFMAVGFRREVRFGRPQAFMLWCLSAPLFFFCAALSLVHKLEANWPAVAYVAAGPGMVWALTGGQWYLLKRKVWTAAALGLAGGLTLIIHLQAVYPFLPVDGKNDPTARLRGWSELTAQVVRDADQLGAQIASEGYGPVSLLRFYSGREIRYEASSSRRSQYDIWSRADLEPQVLFLQPASTPGIPVLCRGARESWRLIRDSGPNLPARAGDYRWWVCPGAREADLENDDED